MRRSLLILLIISLLVAIFALQNSMIVQMKFWFWKSETHLGMVLIIFFIAGALIGIAASLPAIIRKNNQIRDLNKKLSSGGDTGKTVPEAGSEDPEFEDINTTTL